jgi:hypothetical protein
MSDAFETDREQNAVGWPNPYDQLECEPIEEGLGSETLQEYLERCYSVYTMNCSSLIQQRRNSNGN